MTIQLKRLLRTTGASITDGSQEWGRDLAFSLVGLRPWEVVAEDGDVLPPPHLDRFGREVERQAGDSVYFLANLNPITLGAPVMGPGLFDGQRVRLSPVSAAVTLPAGSARGAGASVTVAPGGDVTLLWDATRRVWVLSGGAGAGGGGVVPENLTAGAALTAGQVVTLDTITGQVLPANADFSLGRWRVAGIAATSAPLGGAIQVWTLHGVITPGLFAAPPPAASNRRYVFLDDTDGLLTLTPPDTASAGRVRFVVGMMQGADGITSAPPVLFQPQYISRRP